MFTGDNAATVAATTGTSTTSFVARLQTTSTLFWIDVYVIPDDDEVPHVSELDTRMVLRRGARCVEEFLDYWGENLPDLSERPDIAPESTRFWMMAVSDVSYWFFPQLWRTTCMSGQSFFGILIVLVQATKEKAEKVSFRAPQVNGNEGNGGKQSDRLITRSLWTTGAWRSKTKTTSPLIWLPAVYFACGSITSRKWYVYVTSWNTPTLLLETRLRHLLKHAYVTYWNPPTSLIETRIRYFLYLLTCYVADVPSYAANERLSAGVKVYVDE